MASQLLVSNETRDKQVGTCLHRLPREIWSTILKMLVFNQPIIPAAKTLLSTGNVCWQWFHLSTSFLQRYFIDFKDLSPSFFLKVCPPLQSLNVTSRLPEGTLERFTNLTSLQCNRDVTLNTLIKLTNLRELSTQSTTDNLGALPYLENITSLEHPGELTYENVLRLKNLTQLIQHSFISRNISILTNLRTLRFVMSGNEFNDKDLANLSNLTDLRIDWTRYMKPFTDSSISRLVALQTLCLVDQQEVTDISLKSLSNLKSLEISGESSFTVQAINSLSQLESLSISRNRNYAQGIYLTQLKSLKMSYLQDTKGSISSLSNLEILDIFNFNFDYKEIQNFKKLTFLSSIQIDGFQELENLKVLRISAEGSTLSSESFKNLSNLTELSFRFTVKDGKLFDYVSNLEKLKLNTLKQIEMEDLKKLKFLNKLELPVWEKDNLKSWNCLEHAFIKNKDN